jgi:serine protease Do
MLCPAATIIVRSDFSDHRQSLGRDEPRLAERFGRSTRSSRSGVRGPLGVFASNPSQPFAKEQANQDVGGQKGMMISRRALVGGLGASALLPFGILRAEPGRSIATPIALEEDRIWIAAKIGGSRPLQFIIDTGATVSLIQERLARELDMRERGLTRLIGIGGAENFLLYVGRDVAFSSGVIQRQVVFGAMPGDLILGQQASGVFAAGLFTGADSDLDFSRGEWRLYPDGRGARDGYRELPSSIRHVTGDEYGSAYVMVDAALDGNTFRFLLDTGMPGQVMLWSNAARRSGLWNDSAPFAPSRGSGIGGRGDRGRLVRAGMLRIGDFAFERPLVFVNDPSSYQPERVVDGMIGLNALELLNLSTDVRRGRLWAQPSGRPLRRRHYGMSGIWVEERGDALEIVDLSPGSPAADAGLQRGDAILDLDLDAFAERAGGRPGQSFELRYRRGGDTRTTRLTLRDYL